MAEPALDKQLIEFLREGAPVFVVKADNEGQIREASPFAESLLGRPLAGTPVAEAFVNFGGDPAGFLATLRETARARLMHVATASDLPFEIYVNVTPLADDQGFLILGRPDVLAMVAERKHLLDLQAELHQSTRSYLKRTYARLEQSERQHELILDAAGEGILGLDAEGRLTYANEAATRLLGLARTTIVAQDHGPWLHGQDPHCGDDCPVRAVLASGETRVENQYPFHRPDGSSVVVDLVCTPLHERGRTNGAVLIFRDARERVAAENLLKTRVALSTTALNGNLANILTEAVDAAERLTSSEAGFFHFVSPDQQQVELSIWSTRTRRALCPIIAADGTHPLAQTGLWSDCVRSRQPVVCNDFAAAGGKLPAGHIELRRVLTLPLLRNGRVYALASVGNKAHDYDAADVLMVGELMQTALEIYERKQAEERLQHLTFHDALTELPNRVLLADRLQVAMSTALREGSAMGVCVIDLDGFKPINDRFGRDGGDELLRQVADRLKARMRDGDTLARLGGDEFGVVLGRIHGADECVQVAKRVLKAFDAPFELAGDSVPLAASMGITLFPSDRVEAEALIRHADQAMYAAKQGGRARYKLFDSEFDRRARAHQDILAGVERGLAANEFRLHYQPKVDMRRGVVVGAEALIRWQRGPEQVPPARYMPIVDASDLAIKVGEWVIDTALRQMEDWALTGCLLPVSVNIAANHLQTPDFVDRLRALLAAHPSVPAGRLELEILETATLKNLPEVARVIVACQQIGVRFALYDFGTGYSSLSYLRNLPADVVKIDQSFVRDMLDDPEDMAIVEGVIGLSKAFRREAIAEGVERVNHGVLLIRLGCDLAQGYGIARPMPAEAVPDWTKSWQQPREWDLACLVSCPKEDLPLLIMESEHGRWLERLAELVELGRPAADGDALDEAACFVGRWLNGVGRARHGNKPGFDELAATHRRVHVLATEMILFSSLARFPIGASRDLMRVCGR